MPIKHTVTAISPNDPTKEVSSNAWNDDHTNPDITDVTGLQAALDDKATTASLADKQDTLVSGTNIKTINGSSILGGGDIAIVGAISLSTVEKNLGTSPRRSGKFTITGLSGLTTNKPVSIMQSVGPYTGKGTRADEAEMDGVSVSASVTSATEITAYWNAATRVKGNFKFNYFVGA